MKKWYHLPVLGATLAYIVIVFVTLRTPDIQYSKNIPEEDLIKDGEINLTLEEKVGQLFIIRPDQLLLEESLDIVHNDKVEGVTDFTEILEKNLEKYPVGGFVFFSKNITKPLPLVHFIAQLKKYNKVRPIIAIDEEGGRVVRIARKADFDAPRFISMQRIGTICNFQTAMQVGANIGKYLKNYGFTLNFAPVADINSESNPNNVIGDRSFGSNPYLVSKMVEYYIEGLHASNILSCIKHFPGHGNAIGDSHKGTVRIEKTWDYLLTQDLIPFINNMHKTDAIMVAHIMMDNVTNDNLPASLSKEIITNKLRKELGYDGVIITDALNMGAIKDIFSSGEAAILAVEAGCDLLLMPYNFVEAYNAILEAVRSGVIPIERLDESVKRIIKIKEKF